MDHLLPLSFEPIFQPYLWGGRRLADWFPQAPPEGPLAEAWLLSDEARFPSRVAGGPGAGRTLTDLAGELGPRLLGRAAASGARFPILLKFLDAREHLSVQVHPNDEQAGAGQRGKTEAWVVLRADAGSRIFAGLLPGVGAADLRRAIELRHVPDVLHYFEPAVGDCVFLPAGTIHALGAGLTLFEIQQTSDITYRLFDWDRVEARTGRPRELHIEQGLACIDYARGPVGPVLPVVESPQRERLVDCPQFRLWRHDSAQPMSVGAAGECRVVVAVSGAGELRAGGAALPLRPGALWLLPAELGAAECRPAGRLTVLECGLP